MSDEIYIIPVHSLRVKLSSVTNHKLCKGNMVFVLLFTSLLCSVKQCKNSKVLILSAGMGEIFPVFFFCFCYIAKGATQEAERGLKG